MRFFYPHPGPQQSHVPLHLILCTRACLSLYRHSARGGPRVSARLSPAPGAPWTRPKDPSSALSLGDSWRWGVWLGGHPHVFSALCQVQKQCGCL